MPAILFVCAANQFRSPLAEAAFKQCLEENGIQQGWQVASAGMWATGGLPPIPSALQAAVALGVAIEQHRSQPITGELLSSMDLVIVMQASQREALQLEFPEAARKIFLLSEAADGKVYDIPDPFDAHEDHQQLAEEIFALVRRGFQRLISLAEERA